jgi:hypothetical protein
VIRNRSRLTVAILAIGFAAVWLLATVVPAAAATPYEQRGRTVLIGDSYFGRGEILLQTILRRFFTVRQAPDIHGYPGFSGSRDANGTLNLSRTVLTPDMLDGADLFIMSGFPGQSTVGIPGGGNRQLNHDLTGDELATIGAWVADGGTLVIGIGPEPPKSQRDFLKHFGLEYRSPTGHSIRTREQPMTARGQITGRDYEVVLPGPSASIEGGTAVLAADGNTVAALTSVGRGRVVLLGNTQFFRTSSAMMGERDRFGLGLSPIAQVDNATFVMDLFASAMGVELLSESEREATRWEARLLALSAAMAPVDVLNRRPRSSEGSDFADARRLLTSAARGQRCDLGPGCVPFQIDEDARLVLAVAAEHTDNALGALEQAEVAFDQSDYTAVERAYQAALDYRAQALSTVRHVRDRYDPIGRAYYGERLMLGPVAMLLALGCATLIGMPLLAARIASSRLSLR